MLRNAIDKLHFKISHPHRPYRLWKLLHCSLAPRSDWAKEPFSILERKWHYVPAGPRSWLNTENVADRPVEALAKIWEATFLDYTTGKNYEERGWYHDKYGPQIKGKKILDIGSGFAVDTLKWAREGAQVTFIDVVAANLNLTKRLASYFGVSADYVHLKEVEDLKLLPRDFDFAFALGSLHHAPYAVVYPEVQELLGHLKKGGRWIQLAYPKSRWENDGKVDFSKWGILTDGSGTPWAEWYDLEKMKVLFAPHRFKTLESFEFARGQFIWFDLEIISGAL